MRISACSLYTMRDLVRVFHAVSDETRLRILNLLLERECCVCEVMQALEISQTRASRNLGILHDAGFLKLRKDGLWALYSIDREGMGDSLGELTKVVGRALEGSALAEADRVRLGEARRVGPKCVAVAGRSPDGSGRRSRRRRGVRETARGPA